MHFNEITNVVVIPFQGQNEIQSHFQTQKGAIKARSRTSVSFMPSLPRREHECSLHHCSTYAALFRCVK